MALAIILIKNNNIESMMSHSILVLATTTGYIVSSQVVWEYVRAKKTMFVAHGVRKMEKCNCKKFL